MSQRILTHFLDADKLEGVGGGRPAVEDGYRLPRRYLAAISGLFPVLRMLSACRRLSQT